MRILKPVLKIPYWLLRQHITNRKRHIRRTCGTILRGSVLAVTRVRTARAVRNKSESDDSTLGTPKSRPLHEAFPWTSSRTHSPFTLNSYQIRAGEEYKAHKIRKGSAQSIENNLTLWGWKTKQISAHKTEKNSFPKLQKCRLSTGTITFRVTKTGFGPKIPSHRNLTEISSKILTPTWQLTKRTTRIYGPPKEAEANTWEKSCTDMISLHNIKQTNDRKILRKKS